MDNKCFMRRCCRNYNTLSVNTAKCCKIYNGAFQDLQRSVVEITTRCCKIYIPYIIHSIRYYLEYLLYNQTNLQKIKREIKRIWDRLHTKFRCLIEDINRTERAKRAPQVSNSYYMCPLLSLFRESN